MAVAAFLSYSHKDKRLATEVKSELGKYGFDCFMAHEDIAPSAKWEDEILRQLQACDVFIALLTEAFDESEWTHQEVGIALARNPIMVPINVEMNPAGFLKRYQAIHMDPERVKDACFRIVRSIASQSDRLAQEIRGALIRRLGDTSTYDRAGIIASRLLNLNGLTPDEMNALLEAATANDQVYRSGTASPHLRELIRRHKKVIKKGVLKKFYKVWAYGP